MITSEAISDRVHRAFQLGVGILLLVATAPATALASTPPPKLTIAIAQSILERHREVLKERIQRACERQLAQSSSGVLTISAYSNASPYAFPDENTELSFAYSSSSTFSAEATTCILTTTAQFLDQHQMHRIVEEAVSSSLFWQTSIGIGFEGTAFLPKTMSFFSNWADHRLDTDALPSWAELDTASNCLVAILHSTITLLVEPGEFDPIRALVIPENRYHSH